MNILDTSILLFLYFQIIYYSIIGIYLYNLKWINCKCAITSRYEFIKILTLVLIIISILFVLRLKNKIKGISTLNNNVLYNLTLIILPTLYIIFCIVHVNKLYKYLKNNNCKCINRIISKIINSIYIFQYIIYSILLIFTVALMLYNLVSSK